MPRYEQLKTKSKSISYTRLRNDSKEMNIKKPLIISIVFIVFVSIVFTVIKKYSPMVDIAVKDFFSINHREAFVLKTSGVENDSHKMSFLSEIPLFNFFIKTSTNETLSVMAYKTNSKIETAIDNLDNNNFSNSSIITRESSLPFFNNSGSNNSILYDSGYIDYGNNHNSVLFAKTNSENNLDNNETYLNKEENKNYNYLEQMIFENRNNNIDNSKDIAFNNIRDNVYNENNNNTNLEKNDITDNSQKEQKNINNQKENYDRKSIFDDILKPQEKSKREVSTMKPASSIVSKLNYDNNTVIDNNSKDTNSKYEFDIDKYLKYSNDEKITIIENNTNMNKLENAKNISKKDIIQTSIYNVTNNKPNNDYDRVINDLINPNNNSSDNNINNININNNIERNVNLKKDNNTKLNNDDKNKIMNKAKNDVKKYQNEKSNNTINRVTNDRKLKKNIEGSGIYLVEYSENTGSITLIFRERNFYNNLSIEEAINELLIGATDYENQRNIISCIPKGIKLLDMFVYDDTIYLNFNENFEFNPLGNEGTMVQIYQFVYTATQFEGIDNVVFLIDGKLNETIGSEGAIENIPFRRFK